MKKAPKIIQLILGLPCNCYLLFCHVIFRFVHQSLGICDWFVCDPALSSEECPVSLVQRNVNNARGSNDTFRARIINGLFGDLFCYLRTRTQHHPQPPRPVLLSSMLSFYSNTSSNNKRTKSLCVQVFYDRALHFLLCHLHSGSAVYWFYMI